MQLISAAQQALLFWCCMSGPWVWLAMAQKIPRVSHGKTGCTESLAPPRGTGS